MAGGRAGGPEVSVKLCRMTALALTVTAVLITSAVVMGVQYTRHHHPEFMPTFFNSEQHRHGYPDGRGGGAGRGYEGRNRFWNHYPQDDDDEKPLEYKFTVEEQNQHVEAHATIDRQHQTEKVRVAQVGDADETESFHDFKTNFTAMKAVKAGMCFVQPLNISDAMMQKHRDQQEQPLAGPRGDADGGQLVVQAKPVKKVVLSDHMVHPQVLRFTAGQHIADFCSGLPTHWLVDPAETRHDEPAVVPQQQTRVADAAGSGGGGGTAPGREDGGEMPASPRHREKRQTCHRFKISGCIPVVEICVEYSLVTAECPENNVLGPPPRPPTGPSFTGPPTQPPAPATTTPIPPLMTLVPIPQNTPAP